MRHTQVHYFPRFWNTSFNSGTFLIAFISSMAAEAHSDAAGAKRTRRYKVKGPIWNSHCIYVRLIAFCAGHSSISSTRRPAVYACALLRVRSRTCLGVVEGIRLLVDRYESTML